MPLATSQTKSWTRRAMAKLIKIISGGQTGADQAGLAAAKAMGVATGGMMPQGFRTKFGSMVELRERYGVEEHESPAYLPRTEWNVKNSDGTIRFAYNFRSPGEKATLRLVKQHQKPWLDVPLFVDQSVFMIEDQRIVDIVEFINKHQISVLNVAGNCEIKPYEDRRVFSEVVTILKAAIAEL